MASVMCKDQLGSAAREVRRRETKSGGRLGPAPGFGSAYSWVVTALTSV